MNLVALIEIAELCEAERIAECIRNANWVERAWLNWPKKVIVCEADDGRIVELSLETLRRGVVGH